MASDRDMREDGRLPRLTIVPPGIYEVYLPRAIQVHPGKIKGVPKGDVIMARLLAGYAEKAETAGYASQLVWDLRDTGNTQGVGDSDASEDVNPRLTDFRERIRPSVPFRQQHPERWRDQLADNTLLSVANAKHPIPERAPRPWNMSAKGTGTSNVKGNGANVANGCWRTL